MSICPFANQTMRWDGTWPMSYTSGPWRGLLHTTEGTGVPAYADEKGRKGAKAPHFTLLPDVAQRSVVVYQHFDTNRPSRALSNTTAPGETNREQVVQIELVGTCGWVYTIAPNSKALLWPEAPEWALAGVRRLMRWIEDAHGIPSTSTPRRWTAWNARPDKMSPAEWDKFAGWCGHQHVPENDHTDPGALPIGRLLRGADTGDDDDMALTPDEIADAVWGKILPQVNLGAGAVGPATAGIYVAHTRALLGARDDEIVKLLAQIRDGNAKAIADAIPDGLAREVVDALADRLTVPTPPAA